MWWMLYGYYVMFMCGGQNSWFCKASLRICYIRLFECKGPWMLKTVMNSHVWTKKVTKLDWRSTIYSVVKLSSYFCVWYFLFLIFFIYIVNIGYGKFYVKIFLLVCPVFLTQSVYHVTNTFREILSPSSYQMMGKVSLKTNIWQVLLIT